MDWELVFTVRDALRRPLFADAVIVGGKNGLNRAIRWVHVLESASFESLIHGEEMILTTGMGASADIAASLAFLQNLIDKNAACLCIELGAYFSTIPQEMIELAGRHDFPLIVFTRTVRFVDITLDLHSLIINRHHKMLQELESISREFHRLTLTSQGTLKVLQLLCKSTRTQIVYMQLQGKPLFFPALPPEEQLPLLGFFESLDDELEGIQPDAAPCIREFGHRKIALKPVGALDQTWAYIMMISNHKPQEFDCLLLDSASLSIAQELLRTRYMEERKLFSENLWVDELISGRIEDDNRLKGLVGPDFNMVNELSYRVCLIEIENPRDVKWNSSENDWESITFHLSLIIRSLFEKYSLRPLITLKNNRLTVIALDIQSRLPGKLRLQQALDALQHIRADEKLKDLQLVTGVSKSHKGLKQAYAGYQEAVQSLSLYSCYQKPVLFYEELGVFQLLLNLNDGKTLENFIRSYLGPLIDHDQSKGSELLLTLRVFLDHDGSKQIAARNLFIVRQSLYYRLDKITELLGEDFMLPENRISIQVALRAYQLLYPDKLTLPSSRSAQL
ncbi:MULTISPECIES: PucR family transcriptional regulator ligand-binding domain-containing protein [unclassified Paenibacillus]|uniref:PucR family transcriptional regulator n=1 Tax=unclassified Paenibacillus TaxID=185978 RepID=UPI0024075D51|nr:MULTISPECIES: PucR family transcriptional regulator ligand-binding domain-containing protein [unclassified Paenibacillus]MDF9839994.1 purine catabolism regulator [Paenibacillus sp. PastF-2]MDF9846576.1 purine catabolism regulator [Paenibacillus sp. PastM-2]MDF9853076.1 purine catabolism regulator [Paenibacillus sp. PastF-1]MDH6478420.1 purine catabolism regulator [Paenibacillus sp. PastH-2]MDH6506082.1 purine catabolism regulator [Paenibacillus sp. PastM-3]